MAQRGQGAAARARPAARTGARSGGAAGPGAASDLAATRARLRAIVEPTVRAADLDLEELTVTRAGRRLLVRVTVDGDNGVGHDELTEVSREISDALDEAEQDGGEVTTDSYTLEVSSPGVDRPLTLPRHWRRNVGRLVKVRAGEANLTARVVAVDEAGVVLEAGGRTQTVAFDELGPGRVQVEFRHLDEADLDEADFGEEFDDSGDGPTEQEDGA
jgi:ribosome maturation factor RimP